MSKSELKAEKKKRKREEDGVEEASKKPKKSNKSKDLAGDEITTIPEKKEKKKKDKKSKKSKSGDGEVPIVPPVDTTTVGADLLKPTPPDTTLEQDFIRFDNEPMPDALGSAANGTLSRTASKKEKKKDKKSKKSSAGTDTAAQATGAVIADEEITADSKTDKKKEKKSKKSKEAPDAASDQDNGSSEAMDIDGVEDEKTKVKMDKQSKKDKKMKKSKDKAEPAQERQNGLTTPEEEPTAEMCTNETDDRPSKSKKDKKKEKKGKKEKKEKESSNVGQETNGEPAPEANITSEETAEQNTEPQYEDPEGRISRFIVFVGNLPYSATKERIEAHFAKLKPFEIRMRTYKKNGEFMGTCFIEFQRYDHMQTALTKYHHSVFLDAKKKDGRKINVELSAGGGGNNPDRMQKIKAKNEKLHNERQRKRERREEVESKQKERREKKESLQGKGGEEPDAAVDEAEAAAPSNEHGGMHPARLAMMQQGPPRWQQRNHRQRY